MNIFDVTIPLNAETPVWEGEKGLTIQRSAEIGEKSDYTVSRIEMGLHSGTHVDAPLHVIPSGYAVDQIPLEKLIGMVQVVEVPDNEKIINRDVLEKLAIENSVKKIVFRTTNSLLWVETPAHFQRDFVALDSSGAEYLVAAGMELVGMDFFSVSAYDDLLLPHQILLKKGVVLVENLDLRDVRAGIYEIYCLPLKVVGTDGAPARVVLVSR